MLPDPPTIPAVLALRAADDTALRAIVTADDAITYGELDAASEEAAGRLVAAGVVKGDRVGLLAKNGIAWAVSALGAMRIGAVLVPLSTLLRPPELLAQLQVAAVTHLIATPSFRGRAYLDDVEAAAPGITAALSTGGRHASAPSLRALWALEGLPSARAPKALVAALEARVRPADDLAIMFTSGSRGAPKGVIHTHGGGLRATAAGLGVRCVRPGERLYIPMPMFWVGGFSQGLLTALVAGATLLTEAEPEPTRTLELLQRERVTLFRGWPDQAARLAAHPHFAAADLTDLQDGSLAAVLPPERRPAPGARAILFGMTETFGPYSGDRLDTDLPLEKRGSCGRPFAGVEVRVSDPDTGVAMAAGEQGEIWLRGPNLMRGICGRPRSTVFTQDGYYRTGDLGRLDADGYLWSAGRLDDMFKVKGATVYPIEVEEALRAVPAVRQAYVTEVAAADGQLQVGALVVTDAPIDEVAAGLRERLSAFKVPKRWVLSNDPAAVPMMATGKVDKAGLQRLLDQDGVAR